MAIAKGTCRENRRLWPDRRVIDEWNSFGNVEGVYCVLLFFCCAAIKQCSDQLPMLHVWVSVKRDIDGLVEHRIWTWREIEALVIFFLHGGTANLLPIIVFCSFPVGHMFFVSFPKGCGVFPTMSHLGKEAWCRLEGLQSGFNTVEFLALDVRSLLRNSNSLFDIDMAVRIMALAAVCLAPHNAARIGSYSIS